MHSMITRSMARLGLEERPFVAVAPRERRRPMLISRSPVNSQESRNMPTTKRGAKCIVPFGNPNAPKRRRRRVNHRWSQRPPAVPEWEYNWPVENVVKGTRPRVSEDQILESIDALIEWARDWKLEYSNESDSQNSPLLSEESESSSEPQSHEEFETNMPVSSSSNSPSFSFTYNGENKNLLEIVRPAKFSDEPGGCEPVVVIKLSQIENLSRIFSSLWRDTDLLNNNNYPVLDLRPQNYDNDENCELRDDAITNNNLIESDTFLSAESFANDSTVDNNVNDGSVASKNSDENESGENVHLASTPQEQLRDDEQPTASQSALKISVCDSSGHSNSLPSASTITMDELGIILESLSEQVARSTTEQPGNLSLTETESHHENSSNTVINMVQTVSPGNLNQSEASQFGCNSNALAVSTNQLQSNSSPSRRALALIRTRIFRQPRQQRLKAKQRQLASTSTNQIPPVANIMPTRQFRRVKVRCNIICPSPATLTRVPRRQQVSDYVLTELVRRWERNMPPPVPLQPTSSSLLSLPGRNLAGIPPKRKDKILFLQKIKETVAQVYRLFHPRYVRDLVHIRNVWRWWADVASCQSRASENVRKVAGASSSIAPSNEMEVAKNEDIISNSGQAKNFQSAQTNFHFIKSAAATPFNYFSNQPAPIPPTSEPKHFSERSSDSGLCRLLKPRSRTPKYVRNSRAYQNQRTIVKVHRSEIPMSTATALNQTATSTQARDASVSPSLIAQFSQYPVQVSQTGEPMDCTMSCSEPNYSRDERAIEAMHTNLLDDIMSARVNNELMECDPQSHKENDEGDAMDFDEEWMEFVDAS